MCYFSLHGLQLQSLHFFLTLCLWSSSQIAQVRSESAPKIELDGWSSVDDFQKWNTNLTDIPLGAETNKTVYVITSNIRGLSLICNASYPIQWTFHREKWGNRRTVWQTSLSSQRGSVPETLQPIWFSAEIRFLGSNTEITGNYTCQKYGQPDISTSVYVYWEGSSPPYLTLIPSGRHMRKIIYDTKRTNSFRLPCTVSRPDINVKLYRISKDNETVELKPNDPGSGVNFNSAVGFTVQNMQNPYGVFRCTVGDLEDEDSLEFEIVQGDDRPHAEFDDIIWKTASFSYNDNKTQFVCCSGSSKPPKVAHYYCSHPITCQLQKHALHKLENSGRKYTKGNCSMIPLQVFAAGVLRCMGDSIDIVREYFFPILKTYEKISRSSNNSIQPYFSWTDAMKEKMMAISRVPQPLYIGQTKRFLCQASPFYFAQGIHWTVYYNNTVINVRGNQTNVGKQHSFGIFEQGNKATLELVVENGLKSIKCSAPVWNTTGWGEKTVDITVAKPEMPSIKDNSLQEFSWVSNDTNKILTCSFGGLPKPRIVWRKDNKTVYQNIKTNFTSMISILTIPRVGLEAHATYTCNVTNFAGSAAKVFKVYVAAGSSAEVVVLYVFAAVCVIGACIGAFFGIKKMREQKEAIRRLANVAFKDVTDGLPTAASQQTFQRPISTVDISQPIPTSNGNGSANANVNGGFNGFFNEGNNADSSAPVSDFGRYQKM